MIFLTCTFVYYIFSNTSLEKTRTTVAAVNSVMLAERFIAAYAAVNSHSRISTLRKNFHIRANIIHIYRFRCGVGTVYRP